MSDREPPPYRARWAHVNIVSDDWRRLVDFYVAAFGCEVVGAERDHHGPWVETLTGIPGARIRGVHIRVPGHGEDGPTIEIFQYDRNEERPRTQLNTPGFPHIAFEVSDIDAARQQIVELGGAQVGEHHVRDVPGEGTIELIYMADLDGNVVEIQKWNRDT